MRGSLRVPMPASVRYWIYQYVAARDGERCSNPSCGKGPEEAFLEVHHINGDPNDYKPQNLNLLCRSCNRKKFWERIKEKLATQQPTQSVVSEALSAVKESEGEKTSPNEATTITEAIQKIEQGQSRASVSESENVGGGLRDDRMLAVGSESPELRINREKEHLYRATAIELVLRPEGLTVYQAINEIAEIVAISPTTARRYLGKMVSRAGPLKIGEGKRGHQVLLLREEVWQGIA